MFGRKKNQEKSPRELFDAVGKDLLELINQADLGGIKAFMSKMIDAAPSELLHLYDSNYKSIISAIIKQQNPQMFDYFFGLIRKEYEGRCAQQASLIALFSGLNDSTRDASPTDKAGYYLYHWALLLNQVDLIKEMITTTSNYNAQIKADQYGSAYYALDLVCHHGSADGLQFLLDQEIEWQYKDDLVLQAIGNGHLSILKKLIQEGVKLKRPKKDESIGYLALCEAARVGYLDIVTYLLNEYPDQSIHTQEVIEYAIRQALFAGYFEVVNCLAPRWKGEIGSLAKHLSFHQYENADLHLPCLRFLLDHGADANATDSLFGSLLKRAVSGRNLEAVELLLSRGATPTLGGFRHSMVSGYCADDVKIVEVILKHMNNPPAEQFKDVLYHALAVEDIAMLTMLVGRGAKLDGASLMMAIQSDKARLFSVLMTDYVNCFSNENIKEGAISALKHGYAEMFETLYSKLNPVNVDDFAPYVYIEKQESIGFMKDFASESSAKAAMRSMPFDDGEHEGFFGREKEHVKPDFQHCFQFLLTKGLNPNALVADNQTLLGKAAKANNIDACRVLLLAGANPNQPQAVLPLIFAVNHRNPELTSLLLARGAELGEALIIARKRRYADIANILESRFTPYYIHCGISMFTMVGGGILNHAFSMLVKEPVLLNHLPHGFTANCHFATLKNIIPSLEQYAMLPEGVVDMGLDEDGEHKDTMELDFYYDCTGLDKEIVLNAIDVLKSKYLIKGMGFMSGLGDNSESREDAEAKMMFDPVIVITKTLLQLLNPAPVISIVTKSSLFQSAPYDAGDDDAYSYPSAESMNDVDSDSGYDNDSSEESPMLKKRKF